MLRENKMTNLWQEERGKKFYRVQTNEKQISDRLKRRNKFHLSAISINTSLWIYGCEFTRPDIAKKTLKSITGNNSKIDSEGVISYE
jgi:hypothetical protein